MLKLTAEIGKKEYPVEMGDGGSRLWCVWIKLSNALLILMKGGVVMPVCIVNYDESGALSTAYSDHARTYGPHASILADGLSGNPGLRIVSVRSDSLQLDYQQPRSPSLDDVPVLELPGIQGACELLREIAKLYNTDISFAETAR